jgi:hypothetical protein
MSFWGNNSGGGRGRDAATTKQSIPNLQTGLGRAGAGRTPEVQPDLVPSENNSPAAALERNDLSLNNLKYPLDLGTNYSHILRIFVYKQDKSKFNYSSVSGDQFRFDQQAAANKAQTLSAGWAAGTIAGVKTTAASVEALAGEAGIGVSKVASTVVSGGASTYLATNLDLKRKAKTPVAYISLFMPDTLIVNDTHDYDRVSVTEALGNAGVLQAGGSAVANAFKTGNYGVAGSPATAEGAAMAAKGAGIVGDRILDVNLFSMGYALNPQLEILYQKTKNREFTFQFKFAPRNQAEMQELESIIRTLRFHAAPEYDPSNAGQSRYFIPPSEFEIDYYVGEGTNNRHIPRIAQCVLSNIDVNYAPQGQYAAFIDGAPVEVSMQLTFLETVVLTKADIMLGY